MIIIVTQQEQAIDASHRVGKTFYDAGTMCMNAVILNREQIGEIGDKNLIEK